MSDINTSSTFNPSSVLSTLGGAISKRQSNIEASMSDPNFGTDPAGILKLNVEVAYWSVSIGSTANVIKEIGDAMKSAVQKAG